MSLTSKAATRPIIVTYKEGELTLQIEIRLLFKIVKEGGCLKISNVDMKILGNELTLFTENINIKTEEDQILIGQAAIETARDYIRTEVLKNPSEYLIPLCEVDFTDTWKEVSEFLNNIQ